MVELTPLGKRTLSKNDLIDVLKSFPTIGHAFLKNSHATHHVSNVDHLADILTKPLSRQEFRFSLCKLGVRDLHFEEE